MTANIGREFILVSSTPSSHLPSSSGLTRGSKVRERFPIKLSTTGIPFAQMTKAKVAMFYLLLYDYTPKIKQAKKEQLQNYRLIGDGIGAHFEEIDEDISLSGIIAYKVAHKLRAS